MIILRTSMIAAILREWHRMWVPAQTFAYINYEQPRRALSIAKNHPNTYAARAFHKSVLVKQFSTKLVRGYAPMIVGN
jgi:hypothetical protein